MREYCFSAGRTSSGRTASSRSSRSQSSHHPLFQRKRTLEEFPMDHNLQDTHRLFQERRVNQAKQRQNLVSSTGESKQLSSYSRKRFETALNIKGEQSLPPPSPEDNSLFWEDIKPTWSYRRFLSMSATPISKQIELSPRPGSGPPGSGTLAQGGRKVGFNHLRGNNSAYPTIRRLLQESNAGYRVVCPSPDTDCERCRRPSPDCSAKSEFLLIPFSDEEEEEESVEKVIEEEHIEKSEEQLQDEMVRMSKLEDGESIGEIRLGLETDVIGIEKEPSPKSPRIKSDSTTKGSTSARERVIDEDEGRDEEDEDNPASPWYCWVDDATVSSIESKKDESEIPTAEVTPIASVPEVVAEPIPPIPSESLEKGKLNLPTAKSGVRKSTSSEKRRKSLSAKGKKKGGKRTPEPVVEEIIELPPPPPPPVVEEVVEEVIEEPPEPVLPSYICPSSELKSTQTEIKLWLRKSTFSAANRLLPIY